MEYIKALVGMLHVRFWRHRNPDINKDAVQEICFQYLRNDWWFRQMRLSMYYSTLLRGS